MAKTIVLQAEAQVATSTYVQPASAAAFVGDHRTAVFIATCRGLEASESAAVYPRTAIERCDDVFGDADSDGLTFTPTSDETQALELTEFGALMGWRIDLDGAAAQVSVTLVLKDRDPE